MPLSRTSLTTLLKAWFFKFPPRRLCGLCKRLQPFKLFIGKAELLMNVVLFINTLVILPKFKCWVIEIIAYFIVTFDLGVNTIGLICNVHFHFGILFPFSNFICRGC